MACGCSKKIVAHPTGRTRPTDQCLMCAQKHVAEAYAAWHEYTYAAENRLWIIGQLRSAVSHTYKDYPAIADAIREITHTVQQMKDTQLLDAWGPLAHVIQVAIDVVDPGLAARRAALVDARLNSKA